MSSVDVFDQYAQDYDRWFDDNTAIYQAEVNALSRLVPAQGLGLEVGVGPGRFAVPFGIKLGVEPASGMAHYARQRGIGVCQALGERLPFPDDRFDFALLVTVVCFVDDVPALLREIRRVLKGRGTVIVGFIDRNSALGRLYDSRKDTNKFCRGAHFYAVEEVVRWLHQAGFGEMNVCQTIFGFPGDPLATEQVQEGHGSGAFVALQARKLNELR